MTYLPLIEVEELDVIPDQWKQQLEAAVNQNGVEHSFDKSITVKKEIDTIPFKFVNRK